MKGAMVAMVTGLAALVAVGAVGGTLLVERTLTERVTRALAAKGVNAHVIFSGLTATVSAADPERLPTALRLVLDIPDVVRVEADRSSLPTASTSQPTTSTPAPISTPSPKPNLSEPAASFSPSPSPSPSPASGEMPKSVVEFEGRKSDFPSSERTRVIELAVWLRANPDVTVEVGGHTDNDRSSAFRKELSGKRTRHVVNAPVAAGANHDQLVAVGKADTEPAGSNSIPEGQAESRRMTFVQRREGWTMTGHVLLVTELTTTLVVLIGLALFLGWVLRKCSARVELAAGQETRPIRPTPELETMVVLRNDEKEPISLASRAVPVEAQPVASQPPSPITVTSTPDLRPEAETQPMSIPSSLAPDPSLCTGPSASANPSVRGVPAGAKPAEAKPTGEPQPDLLNDHTVSGESTIDTRMIPWVTGQTPPPTPIAAGPDPRLLEAESRANDTETKAHETEARVEETNQRTLEAEVKAQEAEAEIEEVGQQVTQTDLRVFGAEAHATGAEARVQQVSQHISDVEQARRQVVELEK